MKGPVAALGAAAFVFCLFSSGCVIYPEDGESRRGTFAGFPQNVQTTLRNNGAISFEAPSEIVGLDLSSGYSDYSSVSNTFLFSYTDAGEDKFDKYLSYLCGVLGGYMSVDEDSAHSYYAWLQGDVGIELGFSFQWLSVPNDLSVSAVPPSTLYLLIVIF
jgi:hypothetical protein